MSELQEQMDLSECVSKIDQYCLALKDCQASADPLSQASRVLPDQAAWINSLTSGLLVGKLMTGTRDLFSTLDASRRWVDSALELVLTLDAPQLLLLQPFGSSAFGALEALFVLNKADKTSKEDILARLASGLVTLDALCAALRLCLIERPIPDILDNLDLERRRASVCDVLCALISLCRRTCESRMGHYDLMKCAWQHLTAILSDASKASSKELHKSAASETALCLTRPAHLSSCMASEISLFLVETCSSAFDSIVQAAQTAVLSSSSTPLKSIIRTIRLARYWLAQLASCARSFGESG